jgi:3-carboxy-cis,cis-muconate cycloisomerase
LPGEPVSGAGGIFDAILTTDELLVATGDRAWVQAMLDVEAALARVEAQLGLIPQEAAQAIGARCDASLVDLDELGRAARAGGNPVLPLVATIRAALPDSARDWVHWGATSQDVLDTAAMLVVARSTPLIDADLAQLAEGCAALATAHRSTPMVGRTLLQHALPITFGQKAAGWLVAVLDVRAGLAVVGPRLAVQLGGAAGTLASLGDAGPAVLGALARTLGLAEPVLPWHTDRTRVAEVATALGLVSGAAAKIAWDVALMMQTEVGEVQEPPAPGRGGSSTLPQKRNPVGAAAVGAAERHATALVGILLGAMVQEQERAVGAWQAEWQALGSLLRLSGGAAARVRETVVGLEVSPEAMARNLSQTGGVLLSERVVLALAPSIGRDVALAAVHRAGDRSADSGGSFADELLADPTISGRLAREDMTLLLDPANYLGSAECFVDRALAAYRGA